MDKPHGKDSVIKAIIEAAVPLIAEKGVTNVTFRDIAKAANVNHGLITYYFGNKDKLMHEVARDLGQTMTESIQARGNDLGSVWETVFSGRSTQIRALVRIMLDTPADKSTDSLQFVDSTLQWLRTISPRASYEPDLLMFLVAALFVGAEVVGDHIREALQMSEEDFSRLKPRAFQALFDELKGPAAEADQGLHS